MTMMLNQYILKTVEKKETQTFHYKKSNKIKHIKNIVAKNSSWLCLFKFVQIVTNLIVSVLNPQQATNRLPDSISLSTKNPVCLKKCQCSL